jgi:serine phosphatase RsbU (regulator of sigma subunit)
MYTALTNRLGELHEMWSIDLTMELMRKASQVGDPQEVARLLGHHVAAAMHVDRAIVVSRKDLQYPQFRIIRAFQWNVQTRNFEAVTVTPKREGGCLAQLLYCGEMAVLSTDSAVNDPNADLVGEDRSILAFPLFEAGEAAQMMLLLSPEAVPPHVSELSALALAVNFVERISEGYKLSSQLDAARQALDEELVRAGEVQRMLLPQAIPVLPGVVSAVSYRTANHSGGDYYCVSELPDGRLLLFIADVAGKGAPAAVITAVIATVMQSEKGRCTEPSRVLHHLNRQLCAFGIPSMGGFVTAFCAHLDPLTGTLVYARAGHPIPRVAGPGTGQLTALADPAGLPLGIAPGTTYTQGVVQLTPAETLVVYTDGIVEARSPKRRCFDEKRFDHVLLRLPAASLAPSIIEAINGALSHFTHDAPLNDDQTIVAVTYLGSGSDRGLNRFCTWDPAKKCSRSCCWS